ncbi:hypothetical protein MNB_SV-4-164 [hydrothermal vent metagenome]|uniref:Uncharacterized protein n=1 Tax=hydrothermal vent metagenome TaxID=652676 RepID=A0A1W1EAX5_9ZZZZ
MKKKNENKEEKRPSAQTKESKDHRTPEEIEAFMKRLEKSVEDLKQMPGVIDAYMEKA